MICVQFADPRSFYLSLDLQFLADRLRNDIFYLRQNWHICGRGRPTMVFLASPVEFFKALQF